MARRKECRLVSASGYQMADRKEGQLISAFGHQMAGRKESRYSLQDISDLKNRFKINFTYKIQGHGQVEILNGSIVAT